MRSCLVYDALNALTSSTAHENFASIKVAYHKKYQFHVGVISQQVIVSVMRLTSDKWKFLWNLVNFVSHCLEVQTNINRLICFTDNNFCVILQQSLCFLVTFKITWKTVKTILKFQSRSWTFHVMKLWHVQKCLTRRCVITALYTNDLSQCWIGQKSKKKTKVYSVFC